MALLVLCLPGYAASAIPRGWANILFLQLRKEGARSLCSGESIHGLERDMEAWMHDEISQLVGVQTPFSLGDFRGTDSADWAELAAHFDCAECSLPQVAESLQWAAQAAVDLWVDKQTHEILEGCMGEDTAVALRIELRRIVDHQYPSGFSE